MGHGDPLTYMLTARGVDMSIAPWLYYGKTVERPFTGHAPTPEIKQSIMAEFLSMALKEYPQGTRGEISVVSSCLVTGQSFAMYMVVEILEPPEANHEQPTQGNGEHQRASAETPIQGKGVSELRRRSSGSSGTAS